MAVVTQRRWEELTATEREDLDRQYLHELDECAEPGLTAEGVRAYLAYRRERPFAQITTYEEGQIRKLLRRYVDPSKLPDPVTQEEHTDPVERIGAERFHLTNSKSYVGIMLVLTLVFIAALFVLAFWL